MTTMTHLMSSLDEQGTFFDVKEEAVLTGSGATIPGKKCIVHEDGTPLGIVSTKYKTATNGEIFDKFGAAIEKSGLDLTDASAQVRFADAGARTMVHMRFPAHEIAVRGDDKSILEIVCRNSYDGRWNFSVRGGAVRCACFNGMLLGDWLASYSEYHNAKLNVNVAAEKVVGILGAFEKTGSAWERMLASEISDEKAWRVICRYAGNEDGFKAGIGAYKDHARRTVPVQMMEQYESSERKEIGANAFAVYNTLTHHATHANLRDGKEAVSIDLRARKVATVLASEYWNKRVLAAA